MKMRRALIFCAVLVPFALAYTFETPRRQFKNIEKDPPFVKYSSRWVDSVFNSMSLEQKVAQLFMVEVYPNQQNQERIDSLIKKYGIGGVIYFKGKAQRIAELTNYFQSISKVPVMTAIDGEWGLAMRIEDIEPFPKQLTLGAIQNNSLIYEMGKEIANQCIRLGININFAPVVDINNNYLNPVIGMRSFGENKYNVTQKSYLYAQALQDSRVLPVMKHFPGHGNTNKDSHKELPTISTNAQQLDSIELFPFRELIKEGIGGVMIAHLYVPALDKTPNTPSTISPKIINDLLVNKMKFKGLVFTDALNMKGFSAYTKPGEAEIKALLAGNDILLMSENFKLAFDTIVAAVKNGIIPLELINKKVYKIISAKYWMGLNNFKPIDTTNIVAQLNNTQSQFLKRKLIENALTLISNKNNIIPIKDLGQKKIACVTISDTLQSTFYNYLCRYSKIDFFNIKFEAPVKDYDSLIEKIKNFDIIIVSLHSNKEFSIKTSYGITAQAVNFIDKITENQKVVLTLFANPYSLRFFRNLKNFEAILVAYENINLAEELSAQLIFGGIKASGKLPISINKNFHEGIGFETTSIRLKYSVPSELNINEFYLSSIDTLIENAINNQIFPGCQVMAIKDGIVFFDKQYGYHTYDKKQKVKWDDLYDIASITKVAATTISLMKLYDEGKFDLKAPISNYLPQLANTNKANAKNYEILTHQARLLPYVTFYHLALNPDKTWNENYISQYRTDKCNIQVAQNVFVSEEFQKLYLQKNFESNLLRRKKYKYSDIGFIFYRFVIENLTNQPLDIYVKENFYKHLGCHHLTFKPLENGFPIEKITPSEIDYKYRHQEIRGFTNDFGAAVLGNVSGHAGLFGTTNDLAILFQMLLQNGYYADRQYINPSTIKTFTSQYMFNNRRGLGFDVGNKSSACSLASEQSFGHTGFTGCIVWADPQYNFIYIFLSNRTYPDANNKSINTFKIRQQVQYLLYQSFLQIAK